MAYVGNQPLTTSFITDTFSGDGSTTAFTMSVAPANTASVLVAVSGVLQAPSTYSVSGLTLTFSAAPPTGTGNISVRYLGIPASGVTTTAYRTVTDFTATASQTTFGPPSYTAGFINVYRNGVRLGAADYTASNGVNVVLANACNAGDLVTIESFYVSSVLNAIAASAGAVNTAYLADLAVTTQKLAAGAVTPAKLSQPLTQGTAVNSTSGTSIDFTSIPSWVKRITVMFNGVSTSGSSIVQIQLGAGSVTTTGYKSTVSCGASSVTQYAAATSGFIVDTTYASASLTRAGNYVFTLLGSNVWTGQGNIGGDQTGLVTFACAGGVTLSGTLDRVRITTVNGTDTFDAGSINILYE